MNLRFLITYSVLAGSLIGFSASCYAGEDFYPIGIYCVNSTNDFQMVKEGGFNLMTGPAEKDYLDAAAATGLKVLAQPGTKVGNGFGPATAALVEKTVKGFDSHPALWAWYISDEPDLCDIPPEDVIKFQRAVKSSAAKPTALVLYQGYETLNYGNIADITMIDRYPVPWLPLANFGQHVEMVRLALGKERPLITVIQAFDWGTIPHQLPGKQPLRPPTYDEMRCMTYEALARGANGLFYFAFDAGWKMREHPETWTALTNIVREVHERLPLFQARPVWWAKDHAFADTSTQFNGALESSITSCLLRVRAGNSLLPAGDYILAVNNTEKRHLYSFSLPKRSDNHNTMVQIIGENRTAQPQNGRIQDDFGSYAMHVYGPLD